jgi:hypothetical protein
MERAKSVDQLAKNAKGFPEFETTPVRPFQEEFFLRTCGGFPPLRIGFWYFGLGQVVYGHKGSS